MKKHVILFLFILINTQLSAQTTDTHLFVPAHLPDVSVNVNTMDSNVIRYFPCSNTFFKKNLKVHAGRPATFVIQGLNPFKYKIVLTQRDTAYNEFVPALIATLFTTTLTGAGRNPLIESATMACKDGVSYMKEMSNELKKYTDLMQEYDCVNMDTLKKNQETIINNINKKFVGESGVDIMDKFNCILDTLISSINTGTVTSVQASDSTDVKAIITNYKKFAALNFQDYQYNVPQVQNKDDIIFTLSIFPKDSNTTGGGIHIDSEEIRIPIINGFRINASTGFFWTPLINHTYNLVNDSVKIIAQNGHDSLLKGKKVQQGNINNGSFGLAALFHFYPKISKNFNFGGNLGVGVSLTETTTQVFYLVGLSLIFGNSQRIILNIGGAIGNVDRLQTQYQKNMLYDPGTTSVTTKTLAGNLFVGLTYNIPYFLNGSQNAGASQ